MTKAFDREGSERGDGGAPSARPASDASERSDRIQEAHAGEDDLPVVARMVVEIRSDGSHTVARGGLDDAHSGNRVTIEARGDSPLELAGSLAKAMVRAPAMIRAATGGGRGDAARDSRRAVSEGAERPEAKPGLARRVLRGALRRVSR